MLCLHGSTLCAQGNPFASIYHWADHTWQHIIGNGDIDTLYLWKPATHWTLKTRANISGDSFSATGHNGVQHFTSNLSANMKTTLSLGISYRGLSTSFSVNPNALSGTYHDYEFNISAYYNRFGFDASYHQANSFSGIMSGEDSIVHPVPEGIVNHDVFSFNGYYAFNHRHFSYPAAFTQSFIQQKSSGSLLAAISFQMQHVSVSNTENANAVPFQLYSSDVSIGAGYGYNYVPFRHLLLHISCTPTFIVYSDNYYIFGEQQYPIAYQFPEVIITGRGAVVYSWSRWFIGLTMVYTYSTIGYNETMSLQNQKWIIRAFVGSRF